MALVDHVPKPKTARGCYVTAVVVSIVWLTVFAIVLWAMIQSWNG